MISPKLLPKVVDGEPLKMGTDIVDGSEIR